MEAQTTHDVHTCRYCGKSGGKMAERPIFEGWGKKVGSVYFHLTCWLAHGGKAVR